MTFALGEPLQRAVYDALVQDTGLDALVGSHIYDAPLPLDGTDLPPDYVILGPERTRDRSSKTSRGALHDVTVEVHSNGHGFLSSKRVAGAVCESLLDAELTLETGTCVYLRFLRARADSGQPPNRRRIALTFRAFVEDTSE